MATVAQLTIEMAANISSLRTDMESAKSTVSGAMDSISGHVATAAKSFMGISETMNGTSAALTSLAASAQGLNGLSDQVAGLAKGIDALNAHVEKQTTGWRANVVAISAATSTVKNGIEIFEKFGSVAPMWTKDFGAAKEKLAELGTGVQAFTQNLLGHNKAAVETGPALQVVRAETELAAGGFRAAIPAVAGFVASIAPLLIIAAAVAVVVIAVKTAIAGAGDIASGAIPGFSGMTSSLTPFADALKKVAMEADDFAKKFGSSVTQAATFIGIGERLKISADDGASGMQKLSDAVAESPEKFAALGISIKDSSGKLLPFNDIAKNTQAVIDQYATATDKAGVANHLFSGTAGEVVAAVKLTGPEFIKQQELLKQYNLLIGTDAVESTKRYTKAQDDFTYNASLTWRSMKETIGAVLMPMLADLFEMFTGGWPKVAQAFRDGVETITKKAYALRQTILTMVDDVGGAWDKLKLRFSTAGDVFAAARTGDMDAVKAAYAKLQVDIAAVDEVNRKKAYDREAEYQRRLLELHTSGQGGGTVEKLAEKRWNAEKKGITETIKDLTALQDALEKANLAWKQAAQQAAFQINTDEAKIKIKELELLFKQVGSPEALMKLYDAQLRELELFSQNAQTKIRQAFDYINKLQTELNATTDAERRLKILALIAAEEQKAASIAVELNSEKGKSLAIYDGILEKQRASNKAVFDGSIAIQYATADYITALKNVDDQRALEITLIGKTQLQQDILRSAYQAELEIRKMTLEIARLQQRLLTEMNEDQQILLKRQIAGIQSQVEARKATEDSVPAALALKKATTDVADAWKSVSDTSVNFFNDLFNNGSKAFGNLWTVIKKFFFDLAAQFATKFVINAVLGGNFNGSGIAGSLLSSLFNGGGGGMTGTGSSVDSGFGGSAGSVGGSILSTIMGSSGTIGAMGTAYTGAMAAGEGFLGAMGAAGTALTASGGVLGAAAGVLAAIPVIGWIALAAGAAYAIFGGDRKPGFKVDNNLTNVGNPSSHFTDDAISKFDISGRGTDDAQYQAAFKPFITAVQTIDKVLSEQLLGPDTLAKIRANMNAVNNATSWQNLDAAGIEKGSKDFLMQRYGVIFDQVDAKIAATVRGFTGTSEQLLQFIAGIVNVMVALKDNAVYFKAVVGQVLTVSELTAIAKEGETLTQTLARVITVFSATNGIAAILGKDVPTAFGAVGLASIAARQNLVDLAGGIQQLDAMSKSYYDHYYSQAERGALTLKQQNDAVKATFDSLGIATPKSTAEFRALIEAQDLTTAAGRATVAALLKIEGAFYSINTAVAATQSYLQNYYTQAERDALTRKQRDDDIKATFDALGIATPKSTAEFRALVEAQDLTTAAGRKTYAALMLIQDAFYKVNTAAAAVVSSLAYIPLIDQYARGIGPGQRLANTTDKGPILVRVDPRIKQETDAALGSPGLLAMIAAMGQRSNDGSMGPNGGISPGAGVPVADQNLMKLTLTLRNLESASNQANDTIAKQSNSVLYAYNKQAESIQGLVDMSPRAANAFTSVANGMIAMRDATAAFLVQIDQVKTSVNSMFTNTITTLKLQGMTKEEQYAFYQAQAESARARSLTATDPLEIQRLAGIVNSSVLSANALLTPEQRAQTNPQQIANLDKYNAQIQANLDKVAKDAKDANDAFLARLEAKFTKMTDTQGDISKRNSDAADKQLTAATITRRFKVDFTSNIPGMLRTSEVGG